MKHSTEDAIAWPHIEIDAYGEEASLLVHTDCVERYTIACGKDLHIRLKSSRAHGEHDHIGRIHGET